MGSHDGQAVKFVRLDREGEDAEPGLRQHDAYFFIFQTGCLYCGFVSRVDFASEIVDRADVCLL